MQGMQYIECPTCHFVATHIEEVPSSCPSCGEIDIQHHVMKRPIGFAADRHKKAPIDIGIGTVKFGYSTKARLVVKEKSIEDWDQSFVAGKVQIKAETKRELIVVNKGLKDSGFVMCEGCGRIEPQVGRAFKESVLFKRGQPTTHRHPIFDKNCDSLVDPNKDFFLGYEFPTDLLLIRLQFSPEVSLDFAETANDKIGGTMNLDLGVDMGGLATVDLNFEATDGNAVTLDTWAVGTSVAGVGVAVGDDLGVMPGAEGEQTLAAPAMAEAVQVTVGDAVVAVGLTDWSADITDISNIQGAYTMNVANLDVTAAADYNFKGLPRSSTLPALRLSCHDNCKLLLLCNRFQLCHDAWQIGIQAFAAPYKYSCSVSEHCYLPVFGDPHLARRHLPVCCALLDLGHGLVCAAHSVHGLRHLHAGGRRYRRLHGDVIVHRDVKCYACGLRQCIQVFHVFRCALPQNFQHHVRGVQNLFRVSAHKRKQVLVAFLKRSAERFNAIAHGSVLGRGAHFAVFVCAFS